MRVMRLCEPAVTHVQSQACTSVSHAHTQYGFHTDTAALMDDDGNVCTRMYVPRCRAPRADLKPRDNEVLLNILRCSFRGGGANLSHELPRYSDIVSGRVVWDVSSINDRIPIAFEAWVTCSTLFSVTAGFGTPTPHPIVP